jgi:hypothetical protein
MREERTVQAREGATAIALYVDVASMRGHGRRDELDALRRHNRRGPSLVCVQRTCKVN